MMNLIFITLLIVASLLPVISSTTLAQTNSLDIKKVDFKNFNYNPTCFEETIRARKGEFRRNNGPKKSNSYFSVGKIVYGDLTGDGRDEAVISTYCEQTLRKITEAFIYTMQNRKPVLLARIDPGSGTLGGIHKIEIKDGLLKVERYYSENRFCCPEYIVTETYQIKDGTAELVGEIEKREYKKEEEQNQ
jgi:hypothetical protein